MRIPNGKPRFANVIAALVLGAFLTAQASAQDTDGDGLSNAIETNTGTYVSQTNTGTNPAVADTDGDGAGDWYEVFASFTNPTNGAIEPNVPYPLPKPDNSTGVTNKPVKVFILSGQSNMVGMGDMNPLGANGTLSTIVKTEKKFPNLLDTSGNWSVRKDVQYRGVISAIAKANLTVGQGTNTSSIGPELGMGHVMGYHLDEPVLIIKASQGNRSLGWDYLPPGSPRSTAGTTTYAGYGDSAASWTGPTAPGPPAAGAWYGGWQYDLSFLHENDWYGPGNLAPVENVADVLDNWATQYPQWAAQGFEIAGFAWFQGWNDGLSYNTQYADRYETNLVQLIKQLRTYYQGRYPGKIQTKAPFVVATCGFNGFAATGNRLKVANAQLAVGNPTKYPEFAGNVKSMETRGYWRTQAQSNSKQDYHYWRNAETFMLVGDALGRGMIDLLGANTPQPNVWIQTAGGAQSWTAAANWDDGAIPNPTSTTTMDFSTADLLADTTLNLGANRTAQIWRLGDTSGTQNWIVNAGNTMTLAGTTPTLDVTNNTTRIDAVIAGTAGLTKTGGGILNLQGNNTYTGKTTINGGILQFAKTASLYNGTTGDWTAANLAVSNGGTFALNVGGTGEFTTANVTTLLTNLGGANGTTTTGFASGARIGFDTTNASGGTFTVADAIANSTGTGGGAIGVTKLGAGILLLTNAANTYTGPTTISGGTLQISGSGRLNSGNYAESIFIAPGATLDHAGGGQTLSGAITGGGTLRRSSGTDLILSNSGNSYGALIISNSGGRVFINNSAGALPAAATVTVASGNLVFGFGATRANAISVSSGGILTARNATTLGNITLPSTGTAIFNNDDANTSALSITNDQNLTGALTVQVGGSRMSTTTSALGGVGFTGKISGNGSLTVTSGGNSANTNGLFRSGVLTLSGANNYTGGTTITTGTLALGASNVMPATPLTIANGKLDAATFTDTVGTLAVTGSATINLGTGATLAFADSSASSWGSGTLTLTGTFVSGSSLRFGTSASALTPAQLAKIGSPVFSNFSLNAAGYLTAIPAGSTTYTITNTTTDGNGACTPTGVVSVGSGGGQTYTLTPNAGYAVATLTVNGAPVTPALSYTFNNVSANQTISATFVDIAGAPLHWDSDGTTPGFGSTTGTWGTSSFWSVSANGSSAPLAITTDTDSSVNFGGTALNYNQAAVSVAAGGVNVGDITFGAGQSTALTLSGGVITLGDTAVITTNNASNTIASALAGAGTSLTKAGAGILTLSGTNTYTGITNIAAGTLRLGANNVLPDGPGKGNVSLAGTLDLSTFSETLNGLSGAGSVDTLAGGTPTLTLGAGDATSTFNGTITDTAGTLSLIKTGTGTLTLAGANGYSGLTTISDGILVLSGAGTLGTTSSGLTLSGGQLDLGGLSRTQAAVSITAAATSGDTVRNGTLTGTSYAASNTTGNAIISASLAGPGGFTKSGGGTATLSSPNSYVGKNTISGGILQFAKTASLYNGTTGDWTAANLAVASASTLTLNVGGTNEFATANVTTLLTNLGGANGTTTTGFASGARIGFDTTNASGGTFTVADAIANSTGTGGGAIGVTKLGTGILLLTNAANTYTGPTTISGGTLRLSGSGRLNSGTYAVAMVIAPGATFENATTALQTLSGAITGGGTLRNSNGGGLALTNAGNSYGAISISNNSSRVFINTNAAALPAAATVNITGGNLVFGASATRANAITVSSGGTLTARNATTLSNVALPGSGNVIFNNDDATTNLLTITNDQILTGDLTIQIGGSRMTTTTSALGGVTLSGTLSGDGSLTVTSGGNSGNTNGLFGSGVFTLTGPNDYIGDTTVTSGILALGANDVLPDATAVSIGAATLDATTRTDTADTLAVTAAGTIRLGTGAALAFADSSAIAWPGTLTITGTFVSGASLRFGTDASGLTTAQLARISKTGGGLVSLNSGGFLIDAPYAGWALTNASTTTPAQDQDNDGVSNAVEFVIGGTSLTNDLSKLPAASISGGNILFTFQRAQASINANTTLTIETGTLLHSWPVIYIVGADTATSADGVTVLKGVPAGFDTVTLSMPRSPDLQKFMRLKVIIAP